MDPHETLSHQLLQNEGHDRSDGVLDEQPTQDNYIMEGLETTTNPSAGGKE
jgi:hypothetical protein